MDDSMKWDVLIAAGGEDLDNVMKEASIKTEAKEEIPEVPYRRYRQYQPEIPRGPSGDPPGQAEQQEQLEQQHVPKVPAVVPTKWDNGIKMIENTIQKYMNPIMQRAILMTEMPAANYDDWRTWGLALKEQSQRFAWGKDYTWEVAALDALLYQCPDQHWKKKILAGKWDFQTALDYGIRELFAKLQAEELGNNNRAKGRATEEPVNSVGEASKGPLCKMCIGNHPRYKCPAKSKPCDTKGHVAKSFQCPNNSYYHTRGAGRSAGRGRGNGGNRGNRNSRNGGDNGYNGNNANRNSGNNSSRSQGNNNRPGTGSTTNTRGQPVGTQTAHGNRQVRGGALPLGRGRQRE